MREEIEVRVRPPPQKKKKKLSSGARSTACMMAAPTPQLFRLLRPIHAINNVILSCSVRSVDGRRCRRAWSQPATARDRDRVCHGDHRSCATCQGFPMAAASLLTIGSFKPYGKPAAWLGCGAAPLRDWWIWMTKEVSAQSGSENISDEAAGTAQDLRRPYMARPSWIHRHTF